VKARGGARGRTTGSLSPRRLSALFWLLALAFGALAVRLFLLQTISGPAYARLAVDQRKAVVSFPARRGTILDRSGRSLAVSIDLETVYADPGLVRDPGAAARRLAPVLGEPASALEPALTGDEPGSRFEYIARQIEPRLAAAVEALGIPGVYTRDEAKRFYPNGAVASHVIGTADIDGNGTAGVELAYDDVLRGRPGRMTMEEDPAGRALPQAESSYEPPRPGRDLFLTIDKELQYFTELTLERAARTFRSGSASAIVMRPSTGEVLAMANVPRFDPNYASRATPAAMRNRALTDVYEPGSAYKIVTVSAALEEGVVTPRTRFTVPYEMPYADRVFHDSHFHETEVMTVAEIIEQSSNVGTIKVGLELGARTLDEYVRRFGFGSETGLGFPGEEGGIVLDLPEWSGSTIATVPLGQGIAVTPMQLAAAYSTIANGGTWVEPRLVLGTADDAGRAVSPSPPARRRVVSERTAGQVTDMLVRVVQRGTGLAARVPGYRVAGKTGTAQKALPTGGYGNSYVASFAGYAPAGRPEVTVLVTFDDPEPIWGGETAAPTFRTIMEFALRRLGVPPSGDPSRAAEALEQDGLAGFDAHD
jgi:cell division protein FtsI (penicillin-binding protein 3)